MNAREKQALEEAASRLDGWGLFLPKTTAKLAAKGYFEKAEHPSLGNQWRITAAGRAALAAESA
ncbi:hypothetical protein [Bradyrhizobium sp. SZCCHNR3118]|uniref:hypothetical protein n=1 Tax=Bradyrhizobium sp. SZCCHNR3118 TaxID=3057468 RepID=UPI002915F7F8|nr:hypothetical protein [Bradyrhizobium sp. SZCCHNR3118]